MEGKMCGNSNCNASDFIQLVPGYDSICRDLITEPYVVKDPLLINGYTSIFNVTGKSINDVSNQNPNKKQQIQYKILPNSHVHVTNTVIIDTEKDILRKIEENDPSTIKKLLDSQKMSAAKRLNTFIESAIKNMNGNSNLLKSNRKLSGPNDPKISNMHINKKIKITPVQQVNINKIYNSNKNKQSLQNSISDTGVMKSSPILHSQLKIASVTSINENSMKSGSQMQHSPVVVPSLPVISSVQSVKQSQNTALSEQEKSEFQKMREEINELKDLLKQIGNVKRQD